MLSNTSKYAIRAVIYLALNGKKDEKIGIKQISADLGIPTPFLGKILQSLAKHKLLASTKGPHGGFSLGKSAYDVSLMDIVEIIDGLDSFNMCLLGLATCTSNETNCPVHGNYSGIREQLKDLFQTENIGVLVEKIKTSKNQIII
jgi:Rrf2 family transcriptional regulator, iron-sulfur cluster assembly transcription factor